MQQLAVTWSRRTSYMSRGVASLRSRFLKRTVPSTDSGSSSELLPCRCMIMWMRLSASESHTQACMLHVSAAPSCHLKFAKQLSQECPRKASQTD